MKNIKGDQANEWQNWEGKENKTEGSMTDQNSQAGGEEGGGEVNDLAPGWIDAKGRHCEMGGTT